MLQNLFYRFVTEEHISNFCGCNLFGQLLVLLRVKYSFAVIQDIIFYFLLDNRFSIMAM